MTVLVSGLVFAKDLPPEVQAFRDNAIANSMEVRISGEKLKADYTVLEADENMHEGTYKVADFPKKGVQATVFYRVTGEAVRQIYQDVKRPIRFKNTEEYQEWEAKLREREKTSLNRSLKPLSALRRMPASKPNTGSIRGRCPRM